MTDHTPSGLPQPQTVAAIERARKALHGCYGADTTEINVGVLCELINAAPAVETVAVQEASKREPCAVCGDWLCDANPLPVAPKAEPTEALHPVRQFSMIGKLGKRLAELLDEDQWAECEEMLLAIEHGPWRNLASPQADSAQPVVADTLTDAEVLEYCDTHPEATFAQAVAALASPPRAIPAEQAAPAFYVRDSDVEALKDQRIAGRGAMLHKEAGEGRTAYYAAMGTPAAAEPGKGEGN